MKRDKKFIKYVDQLDKKRLKGSGLGIFYKYIGKEEKAREAFEEGAKEGLQFETRVPQDKLVETKLPDGKITFIREKMTDDEKKVA